MIKGAEHFILRDIPITENRRGLCFSYTPVNRDITINANLLSAEILAYSDYVFGKSDNQEIIRKVINFTFSHQNINGSWYYSFDTETKLPKKQIDFHQGYVLESIRRICDYSDLSLSSYHDQIKSGLNFYRKYQFTNGGTAYWRFPKRWPVDIHNQSQGIITFSLFKDFDREYLHFASKIAEWTINNMQDKVTGHFYYRINRTHIHKTPYMRWSQAWLLLAFAYYFEMQKNIN